MRRATARERPPCRVQSPIPNDAVQHPPANCAQGSSGSVGSGSMGTHRVLQWTTGNVGRAALRTIIARPDLELAGVYVTSKHKDGRDAGELAGTDPVGVTASADREAALALGADVAIHTPLPSLVHGDDPGRDLDDFVALLESGTDVITTVGYMYPAAHGPEVVDRLQAACV